MGSGRKEVTSHLGDRLVFDPQAVNSVDDQKDAVSLAPPGIGLLDALRDAPDGQFQTGARVDPSDADGAGGRSHGAADAFDDCILRDGIDALEQRDLAVRGPALLRRQADGLMLGMVVMNGGEDLLTRLDAEPVSALVARHCVLGPGCPRPGTSPHSPENDDDLRP